VERTELGRYIRFSWDAFALPVRRRVAAEDKRSSNECYLRGGMGLGLLDDDSRADEE
jgi:hypothetical protein